MKAIRLLTPDLNDTIVAFVESLCMTDLQYHVGYTSKWDIHDKVLRTVLDSLSSEEVIVDFSFESWLLLTMNFEQRSTLTYIKKQLQSVIFSKTHYRDFVDVLFGNGTITLLRS